MSTIQKLSNKKGVSYRVFIRIKGIKTISKAFPTKRLAIAFSLKIERDRGAQLAYGGLSNTTTFKEASREYLRIRYQGEYQTGLKTNQSLLVTHCPQFELTVAEACPECTSEGLFRPAAYLGVHIDRWGEGGWEALEKARDRVNDIEACLTKDEFYHLFYRTGLFPSQRVIDDYLENQYRYMEEFYFDYKYQKE